jgi:hypothetical protein
MLLPTGQVLFSPSSSDVQCYTPDGDPQDAWRPVITSVSRHGTPSATDYYLLTGLQLNGLSQGNMYGDDCNPATNYPLVRLHNPKTHQVFFARTYHFSTRAVSAPNAPQSVRFTAAHAPHGHYELWVVANGISSHCFHFCHQHPQKPCGCWQEGECHCHKVCNADACCEEVSMVGPEIIELRGQIKRLDNSVRRLESLIKIEEPPSEPKEVTKKAKEEEEPKKQEESERRAGQTKDRKSK